MSTINPILSYCSAEWYSTADAEEALSIGGDAIKQLNLEKCTGPKNDKAIRFTKASTLIDCMLDMVVFGKASEFNENPRLGADILGGSYHDVTAHPNTVLDIDASRNGDYADIRNLAVYDRATIDGATIHMLVAGMMSLIRLGNHIDIGTLVVHGSVEIPLFAHEHINKIRLHRGGRIRVDMRYLKLDDLKAKIELDNGSKLTWTADGWFFG